MKVSVVSSAWWQSVVTMQLIFVYMAITQVTTSVAFSQVFRCYWYVVGLYVTTMQMTVSVAVIQVEVSAEHIQVTVSAANMWVTIFIVIIQMGVSVAIMQVVFSAVHYAQDYLL